MFSRIWVIYLVITFNFPNCAGQFLVPIEYLSLNSKASCCCGQFTEIFFPNLDFETGPLPGPGTFFTYGTGTNFGGWTVTQGTIDHCDALVGNLGLGNPNGATYFIDLHGSPGLGGISYDLFGLTPGNQYRVEFWTAQNGGGFSSTGYLKIAGGSWLNVNWTVSVSGSVSWRKEMYEFTAQAANATMEFSSSGPMVFAGTLVDDIKIFECPGDMEPPEVLNLPVDLTVECDNQVPAPPRLQLSDNCDPNPSILLKETKVTIDPCTKMITREWTIKDVCDNEVKIQQLIDIIDQTPPEFTKLPQDKIVKCEQDVNKEFTDWIKKNGNATARDDCGPVSWRSSYDRDPHKYCDTILTEFIAISPCGLESIEFATFYVIDTTAPQFTTAAQNKNLICVAGAKDSLKMWIDSFAFAKTSGNCDTVLLSHNFNGDFNQNPVRLTVYAKDRCGNIDSSSAVFTYRTGSDTFRIKEYSCSFAQNSTDTSVFTSHGCDSIVISEKIKLFSDSVYIQNFTCDTFSSGFDTLFLTNVSGCDSLVFMDTELKPKSIISIDLYDCSFSTMRTDTSVFQGQYCDSTVYTHYIPLRKDTTVLQLFTCDSSKAGQQTIVLQNIFGCDSTVISNTLLSTVQTSMQTLFECGLSVGYTDTLVFQAGLCDSLVIRQHVPRPLDTLRLFNQTCDPLLSGVFNFHFFNRFGCDSLVIETIDLLPSDSLILLSSTCNLSQAGFFKDSLLNRFGCDSIVRRVVQFIPSDTTVIQAFTCDPLSVRNDTLVYQTSTCDSVVFRSIKLSASDTVSIQFSTCDFSQAGFDTLRLLNISGCDSLVFVQTQFVPSDTIYSKVFVCNPLFEGMQTFLLKNQEGCDSIIYHSSIFQAIDLFWKIDSINCHGANDGVFYLLNSNDFREPIEYIMNGKIQSGLQSIPNLSPGAYQVYLKDRRGCISDTVEFELFDPSPLITDLGADQTVKKGSPVNVKLISNKNLQQIIWQPNHPASCFNCSDFDFVADRDLWIYALGIDERGCNSLDSVFIQVQRAGNAYVPNVFSPNGDNINDYFYVQGEPGTIVELMQIYDRWGELIFETKNIPVNEPNLGWDGNYKGDKMNPGVFLFVVKILFESGNSQILKGDMSLIR
ncbi:MAG: gliding motility-associated C-terminal domain-containing protein [Saprospiraceae bacterium]|nr:gliding motility-associated C-terminal domain-containing protein [Saprospiraceae bacterium]